MNTTPTQHEDDINLSQLATGVSTLFQRLRTGIFNSIRFFVNHKWILSVLLIGGFATGLFIETVKTSYDHYIVVEPNFGSTDYLYAKVDEINAKIKEHDTVYLKSMGISNPKDIFKIEVKGRSVATVSWPARQADAARAGPRRKTEERSRRARGVHAPAASLIPMQYRAFSACS